MKKAPVEEWIQQTLRLDPPRSKSVVMTVFGDAITPHGGGVWLGSLINLMAPLGMNDRLVRTSVFRLAEEGWMDARREGRRSFYTLTASGGPRFEAAYRRIYFPDGKQWDGKWIIVIVSGLITAVQRGVLRKELLWEGFSMIAPGVYIHPSGKEQVLEELLGRADALGKVFVCTASESDIVESYPLSALIERSWDLKPIIEGYRTFINKFSSIAKILRNAASINAEQSFVVRTLLIHAFRRLHLQDPQLPRELLPQDWPDSAAYELCSEVYKLSFVAAEQFIVETLKLEDDRVPKASSEFYKRFGGLRVA
jgi:phenylacetic acid degradation operon negative regulatory protein